MILTKSYTNLRVLPIMKPDSTGTLLGGLVALFKETEMKDIAIFYGDRLYLNVQDNESNVDYS
jgi:hypothetical protein